jgi:hypothetical protein
MRSLWLTSLWLNLCSPLTAYYRTEVIMGEFLMELWSFMRERKKFWLLPIVLCLVLLGSLIVFTSGSAVAPFIYTLF